MNYLVVGLICLLIGLVIGVYLGAFLISKFDVDNTKYSIDKVKAKKGAKIDLKQTNNNDHGNTKRQLGRNSKRFTRFRFRNRKDNTNKKGQ